MEFLEKLFVRRKLEDENILLTQVQEKSSHSITTEQVRLLLFKECDWGSRKILFDSATINKAPANKHDKIDIKQNVYPCIVEITDGFLYMYKGPDKNTQLLGEMIFGAVGINSRGVSLKIHLMDEPKRLMISKIFCVPTPCRTSYDERETSDVRSDENLGGSDTLNVSQSGQGGVSLSFSMDRGDSGYYGDCTPFGSTGSTNRYSSVSESWDGPVNGDHSFYSSPSRKLSTCSNGSWPRRMFQSMATRFDLGFETSKLLSHQLKPSTSDSSCDSQIHRNTIIGVGTDSFTNSGSTRIARKNKLGLAFLITTLDEKDLIQRCLEHSHQLQALVCRLRISVMMAGSGSGSCFVSTLHQAVTDAANWLSDLLYGPRLQPLWLNLVTCQETRAANKMADSLLSDICNVLSVGDTKDTNFFISTLLTYILTYHLGWVTTVSPYDTVDSYKLQGVQAQKQRYNALWAQLSDLCGSIGYPPKVSRTIICGSSIKFVTKLLNVLTYFMRCGDIKRSHFTFQDCALKQKIKCVDTQNVMAYESQEKINTPDSVNILLANESRINKSLSQSNLSQMLSKNYDNLVISSKKQTVKSGLKRNPTVIMTENFSSDASPQYSEPEVSDADPKVVFVLGDDEKLVGLKYKSSGGKTVKKMSKVQNEPADSEEEKVVGPRPEEDQNEHSKLRLSPPKCCSTLQHSKPIKHSGFKFEFDKYPEIVTNYMKSKNLEILDRHYIGKPGNLKLDNFQFDPTIVPPIQEEECEICYKCQMLENIFETPSNASELEYMNDVPRQTEPQFAKETLVEPEITPKSFTRKSKINTLVVNVKTSVDHSASNTREESIEHELTSDHVDSFVNAKSTGSILVNILECDTKKSSAKKEKVGSKLIDVKEILELPIPHISIEELSSVASGFSLSLLGGITDHYVPDLVLQGSTAKPETFKKLLCRDLDLTTYLNKSVDLSIQAVSIIGDTEKWEVYVLGRYQGGGGGMSGLVGTMLEALPVMWRAGVPSHQCLAYLEGKLRELCVLSKSLADMLMTTDFCDITTLTDSLKIQANDIPLLLAIATTHTPQVARRYGITYR